MVNNIYNNFFNEKIWTNVLNENKNLLDDFLMELKQNKKSEKTIYQYEKDIKGFFCYVYTYCNNVNVLSLTKKDFRKYSIYLVDDCKLSSARHNRLLSAIRSMLSYAENNDDEYDYPNNVSKKVRGLSKESVREIIFLTDDQILKLKNKLIELEEYQKATLLMLAYDSAARRSELFGVKKYSFEDINKNNTNKVIGKRRKVFNLLYFSGTKECVKKWLEQRGNDNIDCLWVISSGQNKRIANNENLYDWFVFMRKLLFEIEGKKINFNPHSIRHSSLNNYSNGTHYVLREMGITEGFPIEKLKILAHHESINTTQDYLPDTSNDELENMFDIKIEK
jgi:integrase